MFSKHIIKLKNHIHVKLTAQYHEADGICGWDRADYTAI